MTNLPFGASIVFISAGSPMLQSMLNELLLALDPAALTTDGVVGWLYPEKKMSRKSGTASSLVFINGLNSFLS
jgi:hypothetical protein